MQHQQQRFKLNFSNLFPANLQCLNFNAINVVGNVTGSGTTLRNINYNVILISLTTIGFNNPTTFISI